MQLRNALTRARGDARYQAKGYTRNDGVDNATDYVALGAAADYQAFTVDYAIVLPVSGRAQTGRIAIVHEAGAAEITEHAYQFKEPEITGLSFGANINAGAVRLEFTKAAVGENPTLYYRIGRVPVGP